MKNPETNISIATLLFKEYIDYEGDEKIKKFKYLDMFDKIKLKKDQILKLKLNVTNLEKIQYMVIENYNSLNLNFRKPIYNGKLRLQELNLRLPINKGKNCYSITIFNKKLGILMSIGDIEYHY